ncbi:hypothetical protein M427DRAFT_336377 [Gonapodya prolifera JEL478]|uniref:RGS domain-containing protein n=1 Tax=Gonapodya prolifera (strain JEL478) TaxID=1344416 RepID=A0A139AD20_GONPJ|nr:hypothetical protein M427DRAFT_336377 [Gonapodya prolifera JEL478]|eukprot:KXS14648.1 hypothetical protein M427DRAFT_336377 [Gonapodya prolifera JEL478]
MGVLQKSSLFLRVLFDQTVLWAAACSVGETQMETLLADMFSGTFFVFASELFLREHRSSLLERSEMIDSPRVRKMVDVETAKRAAQLWVPLNEQEMSPVLDDLALRSFAELSNRFAIRAIKLKWQAMVPAAHLPMVQ